MVYKHSWQNCPIKLCFALMVFRSTKFDSPGSLAQLPSAPAYSTRAGASHPIHQRKKKKRIRKGEQHPQRRSRFFPVAASALRSRLLQRLTPFLLAVAAACTPWSCLPGSTPTSARRPEVLNTASLSALLFPFLFMCSFGGQLIPCLIPTT
jgi:hypothetical protein